MSDQTQMAKIIGDAVAQGFRAGAAFANNMRSKEAQKEAEKRGYGSTDKGDTFAEGFDAGRESMTEALARLEERVAEQTTLLNRLQKL